MKIVSVFKADSGYPEELDGSLAVKFQCKLLSDRVNGHLCILRRQELDLKGGFICEGCFMDRIMSM